jgi:hypothetical protein
MRHSCFALISVLSLVDDMEARSTRYFINGDKYAVHACETDRTAERGYAM